MCLVFFRYHSKYNAAEQLKFGGNTGSFYYKEKPLQTDFKVFQQIPISSHLLANYDPFYSPLLSRIDSVFKQLNYKTESCRERLICAMYNNPAKYAPYSNLISAQLSRELNELRKPTVDNPEILRFFRYMKAAKDGQDQQDCEQVYNACATGGRGGGTMETSPPMVTTFNDINRLVHARKINATSDVTNEPFESSIGPFESSKDSSGSPFDATKDVTNEPFGTPMYSFSGSSKVPKESLGLSGSGPSGVSGTFEGQRFAQTSDGSTSSMAESRGVTIDLNGSLARVKIGEESNIPKLSSEPDTVANEAEPFRVIREKEGQSSLVLGVRAGQRGLPAKVRLRKSSLNTSFREDEPQSGDDKTELSHLSRHHQSSRHHQLGFELWELR
uniref:Uncharacterized protein n=1 Tax=Cacopsylla melanoneura TaxID=428564 RepID=A0A8D8Z5E6_9HEMI